MTQETFRIRNEAFEGPLDLLLQLIEAEELEITTIALAEVTDQYLSRVKDLKREDLAEISDYLVIAARLLLLKSRALLPEDSVSEEEDPDDLAAQLLEYKRFKEMALNLEERLQAPGRSFSKLPTAITLPEEVVTDGVDIDGLHHAFCEILDRMPEPTPLKEESLEPAVTIEECIDAIKTALAKGPAAFSAMFTKLQSRVQMIVTFLAILELIKQSLLTVTNRDRKIFVSLNT